VRALVGLCVAGVLLAVASGSFGRTTADTWAGTWETEWGLMTLKQSGTTVTGTYPHDEGRISGTVSGNTFKGRWNEAPTRKGPGDAGAVEFTMSADGKKLTGRWTYDGSPTAWHTDWTGTCKNGACRQNVAAPVTGTAQPGGSGGSGAVEPRVWGDDWDDSAIPVRNEAGPRFVFVCPAAGRRDQAWGTDVYTDNSSVCTAAVHSGAIVHANGGIVTIEHLPGQASYTGSTRNGITSVDWGPYPGSFRIVGAVKGSDVPGVKMGGAGWTASATRFRGQNGARFRYLCPGGAGLGSVTGTNTYADDSSVCGAAVHVGLLTRAEGGRVTIQIALRQSSYRGSSFNGVQSQASSNAGGSFTLVGAPVLPGGPGGGGGGGTTTTTTPSGGSAAPPTATATGTVLVNGAPFTTGTVPYGATVDVTNGSLTLRADVGTLTVRGGGISANFKLIRAIEKKKPIVELRLVKGSFAACPKRKTKSVSQATPTAVVRQLWGNGKGKFRTRGRYASATVRGTNWLTADRCDGTFVRVRVGVIQVNDLPDRRLVTVRAPRTYLAGP
jgi:hypothetical protein